MGSWTRFIGFNARDLAAKVVNAAGCLPTSSAMIPDRLVKEQAESEGLDKVFTDAGFLNGVRLAVACLT